MPFAKRIDGRSIGCFAVVVVCAGLAISPALADYTQQGDKLVGAGSVGATPNQGYSVALSADGNTLAVGGLVDNNNVGATWVFTRQAGVWTPQGAKLVGTGGIDKSEQGFAVALSGDGNTLLVGAPLDHSIAQCGTIGTAWVFVRNNGAWTQQTKLLDQDGVGCPSFGSAVALSYDGNTALIGGGTDNSSVGAAFVFVRNGSTWSQQGPKLLGSGAVGAPAWGRAVALSADGNTAILGGFRDNSNRGAAWVFTRSGATWTQQGSKLVPTGAAAGDRTGASVALSSDGSTAAIGAPGLGSAWVFTRAGNIWSQQGSFLEGAIYGGDAVALSADGNMLVLGQRDEATGIGSSLAFIRRAGVWSQFGPLLRGAGFQGFPRQGYAVAISGNGGTAAFGGPYDSSGFGATWVFTTPVAAAHDFNGSDGKSDILWRDTSGNAAIWFMNGASVLASTAIGSAPTQWAIVGQRDFNGDGKHDIVWRHSTGALAIWLMSSGNVLSSANIGTVPASWSVAGTGDLNGDGKGDIVWRDTSGNIAVWLMNGASIVSAVALGNIPMSWTLVGTADFNGDGRADLLWRFTDGTVVIWFMNGTGVASTAVVGNVPTAWSIAGLGDFDGNGKTDLVWRDTSGNVSIWLMNGASVVSAGAIGLVPVAYSLAQTGDYNGDGRSELLWRNTSGATVMWSMNGAVLHATASVGTVPTSWTVQNVNAN